MQEELDALVRLINTWQEENITLAFQIMKGNKALREAAKEIYAPIMAVIGKKFSKNNLLNIPIELGYASNCHLDIPISDKMTEIMSSLPIERVDYSFQELTVFPWWVFKFSRLKELRLSNNKLRIVPEEIAQLIELEELNLDHNKLQGLAEGLGKLSKLEKLQLDFNEIKEIPDSLGGLESLEWLCLEGNQIERLPKSAENLENLSWLSIEKTPLGKKHKIYDGIYIDVSSKKFKKLLDL